MHTLSLAPSPDPAIDQSAGGVVFTFERPQDSPAVDALVDAAFGPGRYAKAAERLREGNEPRLDLSICAWSGDRLVGVVRQWRVRIGGTEAVFLGPFAVASDERGQGLGSALISRAVDAARAGGERLVLLVGDAPFFRPLGFEPVAPGVVAMPGPVDARRVMWRGLAPGALDGVGGPVRPPERP